MRRPGDGGRVLHQGFLDAAEPEQRGAEAGVRQGPRGGDVRGSAVRRQGFLERATKHGHMADSQRLLVALV